MLLSRLDLKAFGKFTDVSIDLSGGPHKFHLIYGPNEAGKSTSLRAITSLLFGMESGTDDCFQHRPANIRVGGLLVDSASGQQLECIRRRGRKDTLRDENDREPISEQQLVEMMGGIKRDAFLTRFGLSYESLVEGGVAIVEGGGDLGEILFAAGAGIGRLREVQSELDIASNALFTPRSTKASINANLKLIEADRGVMKEALVSTSDFNNRKKTLAEHQGKSERLQEELRESLKRLDRLSARRDAVSDIPAWIDARRKLAELKSVPSLEEAFIERRRKSQSDLEIAKSQKNKLQSRLSGLEKRKEALASDLPLLNKEKEIQRVFQEVAIREQADRDAEDASIALQELDRKIDELLESLIEKFSVETSAPVADADGRTADRDGALQRYHVNDGVLLGMRDLAGRHQELLSRKKETSKNLEAGQRRLKEVDEQLLQLADVSDPAPLVSVLEAIGNPSTLIDALSRQRLVCSASHRKCDQLMRQLHGFDGDIEDAVDLQLPTTTAIQVASKEINDANGEIIRVEDEIRRKEAELAEHKIQLSAAEAGVVYPSHEELLSFRKKRDDLIVRLIEMVEASEDPQSLLDSVRQSTVEADRIVDSRLSHSEQVHHRVATEEKILILGQQITALETTVLECREVHAATIANWESLWSRCKVTAKTPVEMKEWVERHQDLCEASLKWKSDQETREDLERKVQREVDQLSNVLNLPLDGQARSGEPKQRELFIERIEDSLTTLHVQASAMRSQKVPLWLERQSLSQRRSDLVDQLPDLEVSYQTADDALAAWSEAWARMTDGLMSGEALIYEEIVAWLNEVTQVNQFRQQRDELHARLATIESDRTAYRKSVEQLVDVIGDSSLAGQESIGIAKDIYQRLLAEREVFQKRAACDEDLDSVEQEFAEAEQKFQVANKILEQLCREAGAETIDLLPEIERQARIKHDLLSTFERLDEKLTRLAGDLELEAFVSEASEQSESVWEHEVQQERGRQASLSDQYSVSQQEIGAIQNELSRIDGDAKAFDVKQRIELKAGLIRSDVERYLVTRLGAKLLHRAIEHYRQENQSPVLNYATRYFEQLTCGEYVELRPDYDSSGKSALFVIHRSGDQVAVNGLSTGTADALYLSLRMASLEHQIEHTRAMPVVVDDCLIQLDDQRAAAALKALSALSEKTQVILFTHHQHLKELASENLGKEEFHLHHLGASS